MIKTIIFDFDGTIADTWKAIIKILKDKQTEWGLPQITEEMIEDFRGKDGFELLKKYKFVLWKLPFIIPKAQKELGKNIDDVQIFDGIREVLFKLKEKKFVLGILTTNSEENVNSFLKLHYLDFFKFVQSERSLFGKGKALKNLMDKNSLTSNEVIYIGDEVRDIDACRENKIPIISVTWGFNSKEILQKNKPDYLVNKPEEILKIISK